METRPTQALHLPTPHPSTEGGSQRSMLNRSLDPTKQQLLHFPFFTIPTPTWLRQGLLYWDGLAFFADGRRVDALCSLSPDVAFLIQEGLLTPLKPDCLFVPSILHAQAERDRERAALMETPQARAFLTSPAAEAMRAWLVDSITLVESQVAATEGGLAFEDGVRKHLEDLESLDLAEKVQTRLAKRLGVSVEQARHYAVLRFALHWGLLARDFGALEAGRYMPSTDLMPLGQLMFSPIGMHGDYSVLGLVLSNVLPTPAERTRIADVLRFRERNWARYQRFRVTIDQVSIELGSAATEQVALRRLSRFARDMEAQRLDLARRLRRRKIEAVSSTVDVVLNTKTSPLFGVLAGLIFTSGGPIWWKATGIGAPLVVSITRHAIRERNAIAAELDASPAAYLHSAKQQGLLQEALPIRWFFRTLQKRVSRHGTNRVSKGGC